MFGAFKINWYQVCVTHKCRNECFTFNRTNLLNDLLGGRGWWLVKGALVRGPFLFITDYTDSNHGLPGLFPRLHGLFEGSIDASRIPHLIQLCDPYNH